MKLSLLFFAVALAGMPAAKAARPEVEIYGPGTPASAVRATENELVVTGSWDLSACGSFDLEFERELERNVDTVVAVVMENPGALVPDPRGDRSRGAYEIRLTVPRAASVLTRPIPPAMPELEACVARLDTVRFNGMYDLVWPNDYWGGKTEETLWGNKIVAWTLDAAKVTRVTVRFRKPGLPRLKRIVAYGPKNEVKDWPAFAKLPPERFFPFIDRFGQFKWRDWPGKVHDESDLRRAIAEEDRDLAAHPGPKGRDKWGGWAEGPRFEATGAFTVRKVDGQWWFVDPDGCLWWSHGPVRVSTSCGMTRYDGRENYFEFLPEATSPFAAFYRTRDELMWPYYVKWGVTNTYDFTSSNLYRKYGADWVGKWADRVHRRLKSWGANTIANSSDIRAMRLSRTPYCDRFEIKSRPIKGSEKVLAWWPLRDPFDPSFRADIRRQMREHKAEMEDPWCFGFFVDNELPWGALGDAARFVWESPDDQPAKVEFRRRLAAKYGRVPETPPEDDCKAFSVALAETYFAGVREEFKKAAPNKLYMGCRFCGFPDFVVTAAAKYVDVLSFNYYHKDVTEFPQLPDGVDKPVVIGEFHFGATDRGPFRGGVIALRDQAERAETYKRYLTSALRDPRFVGAHWHQYSDDVSTGRFDGENFQIGWVDICDNPYPETIEAVRWVGDNLYELRRSASLPFGAAAVTPAGTNRAVRCESRGDGRFALLFERGGEAVFSERRFPWGVRYTHETLTVPGTRVFLFGRVDAPWATYRGKFANMLSDETRAVCVRAYDVAARMVCEDRALELETTPAHGLVGTRFAVVEGSREGFRERLQEMTRDFCAVTGVPLPANGGAFAQSAEAVRGSYFMVTPQTDLMDDAIDMALRSGATILHFKNWWQTIGHYRASTNLFPRGEADFLAAADGIRRAGLTSSMHSLTAGVGIDDDWVRDGHAAQFKVFPGFGYTLARSLDAQAEELVVNEPIRDGHHRTMTYLGNGNALRVGAEIVQYSDFDPARRAFTGLVRGALGTRPSAHPAGTSADYLQQRYREFYPVSGSPLVGEIADTLAARFRDGGFTQFYFDGAEGLMDRFDEDSARRAIYCRLAAVRDPVVEASAYGAHNWWWHSRTGTWDTPIWNMKRYHDLHLRALDATRKADFLAVGTGWFYPKASNWQSRGFTRDEIEYFAAKNAGRDYPCSVGVGGPFKGRRVTPSETDAFTLIGWYERLRRVRAFAPGLCARMNAGQGEWRLRQNAAGVWTLRPVTFASDGQSVTLAGGEPLALRVTGLWDADATTARTLVPSVGRVTSGRPFVRTWDHPLASVLPARMNAESIQSRPAWRLRVKGDGRGGVLRLRLVTPREFGAATADHRVPLDFTGWQTVTLFDRERDAATDDVMKRYVVYRNPIDPAHISEVSVSLEDGEDRSVEVGSVEALLPRATSRSGLAVVANGVRMPVPFALAGDEYAELEDGLWRKYDGTGLVVGEAEGPRPLARAGENAFAVEGAAHVTVQALGPESPALAENLTTTQRAALVREYDLTRVWNPAAGVTRLDPVVIRPDEKARLQVRFVNAPKGAVLKVGGTPLAEGLSEAVFSGSNAVTFDSASTKPVRIEIAKVYTDEERVLAGGER